MEQMSVVRLSRSWLPWVFFALALSSCGIVSDLVQGGGTVEGYPDVDLGAEVMVYKGTSERDLHLHFFEPAEATEAASAVLFFHGGGFANTRVEQFERQAQLAADAGMVGIVVEYRVTAEGTTVNDAIDDGRDALAFVLARAQRLGIDPDRVAMAGSSVGGALATEASTNSGALVLFNPAVGLDDAGFAGSTPAIAFHSRQDTIVSFSLVEEFCDAAVDCELVAFDEGDHGFFNDEPAFTETSDRMIEFLLDLGW